MSLKAKLDAVPDVEIDCFGTFKYIQIRVHTEGDDNKIIIRGNCNADYHSDIFEEVGPGIDALGLDASPIAGGRIRHEPDEKILKVYGYSMGYGKADHSLTKTILQKKYPDYKIEISDKGY
uniref:sex-regulated protein janus-A-like n=1 Tax=Styela clava TaxID=7725 RepID=UPI00193A6E08|nr:sex-regulated protein janus-A-like [Styela clava]